MKTQSALLALLICLNAFEGFGFRKHDAATGNNAPGCPQDFDLEPHHRQQCIRVSTIPADVDCPSNFKVCADGCCKATPIKPQLTCPAGMSLQGSFCVTLRTAHPSDVCQEGFEACTKGCCRTVHHSPQKICPESYQLCKNGEACCSSVLSPVEWVCPADSTPILSNGICEGTCQKVTQTESHATCPEDFSMNGSGSCDRVVVTESLDTCPLGFELVPSISSVLAQYSTTFQHVWTRNLRKEVSEARQQCVHTDMRAANAVCNEAAGFTLMEDSRAHSGAVCTKHQVQEVMWECPAGYELVAGECIRVMRQAPTARCPAPFSLQQDYRSPNCQLLETTVPGRQCPNGYELVGDGCARVQVKTPASACPEGFALLPDGSACGRREVTPAQLECPADFAAVAAHESSSTVCQHVATFPAMKKGGVLQTTQVAHQFACEQGFHLCSESSCCQTQYTEPLSTCPAGFSPPNTPNAPPMVLSECWQLQTAAPEVLCPQHSVDHRGKCFAVESCPSTFRCPQGYELDAAEHACKRIETVAIQCPAGMTYDGNGMCIGTVQVTSSHASATAIHHGFHSHF